jgi:DNA-binding transcriptional ArsR family regulator
MSHYLTALAMQQRGLKPGAKILLYWLADHHNGETGECFPSISRIADLCEMSRRAVECHLQSLQEAGLVSIRKRFRENGGATSNAYTLNLSPVGAQKVHEGCAESAQAPTQNLRTNNLGITNLGNEQEKDASGEASLFSEMEQPKEEDQTVVLFDRFWKVYPKKSGKPSAFKAFKAAVRKVPAENLIAAAARYAEWLGSARRGEFRPPAKMAQGWLNDERWNDPEIAARAPVDRAAELRARYSRDVL